MLPKNSPHLNGIFILPPLVMYLRDADRLPSSILEKLIHAVDPEDGEMVTEPGWITDCTRPYWIFGTSDSMLADQKGMNCFTKLTFSRLSPCDVERIVREKNCDLPAPATTIIAQHAARPHDAMNLVQEMQIERQMNPHRSWIDTAKAVVADHA